MKRLPGPERRPRTARRVAVSLVAIVVMTLALINCASVDPWRGPVNDHFDGKVFRNQPGVPPRPSLSDALRWNFNRARGEWPEYVDAEPGPKPPERVGPGELRVTFVGHATVLLQIDGVNLLTDPVWSDRVGPLSWVGAKRHRPPGIRFEDLPPIDAVLLSHDHFDHLDIPTLRRLFDLRPTARVVTGLNVGNHFGKDERPRFTELDWWDETNVANLKIIATPAAHWSSRVGGTNRTLWVGFAIVGSSGWIYFAGDTGWGPHFQELRERLGSPRLAILPVGAYLPRWFMHPQHIDPAQAIEAARILGAQASIPIHFGTFDLADDGEKEPVEELKRALREMQDAPPFETLEHGEGRAIPAIEVADL